MYEDDINKILNNPDQNMKNYGVSLI